MGENNKQMKQQRINFQNIQATHGEGNGAPLQYSRLENPMDGGAWWLQSPSSEESVTKNRAWLSDFTFTFQFHALEKEMATHSSVLAWRIPGMGEPGGLPSMGLHRVGHDWSDLAWTFFIIYIPTVMLDVLWIMIPLRIWWSNEACSKNRYMHKSQQSCISCQGFVNFLAPIPGPPS